MTELVLPNDTNVYGNLMGGRLMYWMDIAAALSAGKITATAPVVYLLRLIIFHLKIPSGWVMWCISKPK